MFRNDYTDSLSVIFEKMKRNFASDADTGCSVTATSLHLDLPDPGQSCSESIRTPEPEVRFCTSVRSVSIAWNQEAAHSTEPTDY